MTIKKIKQRNMAVGAANQFRIDAVFTEGKLLALRGALINYAQFSTVGKDVLLELDRAMVAAGLEIVQNPNNNS